MTGDAAERNVAGRVPPATFVALAAQWAAAGMSAIAFSGFLAALSPSFATSIDMGQRPIVALVVALVAANAAAMVLLPGLILRAHAIQGRPLAALVWGVVFAGLLARIALFGSQPILENDFQRYLWDGAVTAHGQDPYAYSPATVLSGEGGGALAKLAREGSDTLSRIGHKDLTTIYPPLAQAAFALAHRLAPWSLDGWRLVLLVGDIATLFLLFALLDGAGRSRLWASLYWLNPLVLKEVFNSAHMEAILLPFVLGALVLVWRQRKGFAIAALAMAAGVKLWPVILAPLVARASVWTPGRLSSAALCLCAVIALWLIPMVSTAPGETPGLLAYAQSWQTNSALSPALEGAILALLPQHPDAEVTAARLARVLLAAALAAVILFSVWRPVRNIEDLIARASLIAGALVLLSPAQYPWYLLWYAPFLAFGPALAPRVAMVSVPLYYLSFHFAARDQAEVFTSVVVWMIWLPVWLALLWQLRHQLTANAAATHEHGAQA